MATMKIDNLTAVLVEVSLITLKRTEEKKNPRRIRTLTPGNALMRLKGLLAPQRLNTPLETIRPRACVRRRARHHPQK